MQNCHNRKPRHRQHLYFKAFFLSTFWYIDFNVHQIQRVFSATSLVIMARPSGFFFLLPFPLPLTLSQPFLHFARKRNWNSIKIINLSSCFRRPSAHTPSCFPFQKQQQTAANANFHGKQTERSSSSTGQQLSTIGIRMMRTKRLIEFDRGRTEQEQWKGYYFVRPYTRLAVCCAVVTGNWHSRAELASRIRLSISRTITFC